MLKNRLQARLSIDKWNVFIVSFEVAALEAASLGPCDCPNNTDADISRIQSHRPMLLHWI